LDDRLFPAAFVVKCGRYSTGLTRCPSRKNTQEFRKNVGPAFIGLFDIFTTLGSRQRPHPLPTASRDTVASRPLQGGAAVRARDEIHTGLRPVVERNGITGGE